MSRRWKITFALFVLGIGGLLGWAFHLASTPPLTLHFQGYMTNEGPRQPVALNAPTGAVLAVFSMTNRTRSLMLVMADSTYGSPPQVGDDPAVWIDAPDAGNARGAVWARLKPGESARAGAVMRESGQPVGIEATGSTRPEADSVWNRFVRRIPWIRGTFSVSATNEPR